jgi:oligopeptide transport system substrate-binding protein
MKRLLLLLILPSLALAGCGQGNFSARGAEGRAGTLRYALAQNPTTLDPGRAQGVDAIELLANVYEGLVAYDEQNRIEGRLAERWDLEDDGRTYVFHLREAKFHNGRTLEAADIKWSFERNLSPEFASPTALNYLDDIVGAREFAEGQAESVSGIVARDARTLAITIRDPRPYFLGKITYPVGWVLAKEAAGVKELSQREEMVGTGPFTMAEVVPDQMVALAAFPDYYGGAPNLARIERPIIRDSATRLNKYRGGELDLLSLDRQDEPMVEKDAELRGHMDRIPVPIIHYVSLNQNAYAPFRDGRVRRALAMSIDRETLGREVLQGMPVAYGLVPPGIPGHRPDYRGVGYDPDAARALLAQTQWREPKGLPKLEIAYRDNAPDARLVGEEIVTQLRRQGWPVELRAMELRSFLEARNAKRLQSFYLNWYADYLDPENFLSFLLHSESPQNRDGYANAEFDRLVEEADRTFDEDRRMELYGRAESIAVEDAARIPIYFGRTVMLVNPRVKGVRTNLFGVMPHGRVTVE